MKRKNYHYLFTFTLSALVTLTSLSTFGFDSDELKLSADLYASHSNLTTFKGYQDDASLTFKLKYTDFMLQPFAKLSTSHYYYLDERIANNTTYTSEHRNEYGLGLDLVILPFLKIRYIYEYGKNLVTDRNYEQESYIIIYNQFFDFVSFQLNNYLESAIFPRLSTNKFNTYIRVQALKTFDISRTIDTSHVVYPFLQVKYKDNEERLFGFSGHAETVGLGYKAYSKFSAESSAAFLLEAHSVLYQSTNFNGDWLQALAVVQLSYR